MKHSNDQQSEAASNKRQGRPAHAEGLRAFNSTRQTLLAAKVEVAGTGATRSKGLLGRKSLPRGEALWIVPCEAVHTFWMQFALDLVYLDRENRVRKIRRHVPPWRLSACLTAHSVLEFAAGSVSEELALPGDQIEFSPWQADSGQR